MFHTMSKAQVAPVPARNVVAVLGTVALLAGLFLPLSESVARADETSAAKAETKTTVPTATVETLRVTADDDARDARGTPFYNSRGPDTPPASQPAPPTETGSDEVRERLALRYGDPVVVRFANSLSTERAVTLFREATQLIDSRHIDPASQAKRTHRGLENLSVAVGTPEFLQAFGMQPNERDAWKFRESLKQLAGQPVRSANDALRVMYTAMRLGGDVGMPSRAVALEFVYASTETLDRYSTLVPKAPSARPSASLEEHVVGIGVEIKATDAGLRVGRVLRGGPAEKGGLKRGDLITAVNGETMAGAAIEKAVDEITGPAGSRVLLSVMRGERKGLFTLTRARVEIHSVSEFRIVDRTNGIGYVKLDRFSENSSEEMDEALWSLYEDGMETLIIDLRGNPGGLLTTAIELSDKFLPCGTIVATKGRTTRDNSSERATFDRTWSLPLVVLVDGHSASASEIFAAAIQENERGLVVGTQSYGKGTVQTHFPLETVSGNLKLTTAYFYSPNGRKMAGEGVTPDVVVDEEIPEGRFGLPGDPQMTAAVHAARGEKVVELAESASECKLPTASAPVSQPAPTASWPSPWQPIVNTWPPLVPTGYFPG